MQLMPKTAAGLGGGLEDAYVSVVASAVSLFRSCEAVAATSLCTAKGRLKQTLCGVRCGGGFRTRGIKPSSIRTGGSRFL